MGARSTPSTTRVYKREHTVTRKNPLLGRARHQATFNLLREELSIEISADEDDLRHPTFPLLPLGLGRPKINLFVHALKNELLIALTSEGQDTLASI